MRALQAERVDHATAVLETDEPLQSKGFRGFAPEVVLSEQFWFEFVI